MATRPPGWYVDPDLPRLERYWDGTEWTKDRRVPPSHPLHLVPGRFGDAPGPAAPGIPQVRAVRLPGRSTLLGLVALLPVTAAAAMTVVPAAALAQHLWPPVGGAVLVAVWLMPVPLFFFRPAQYQLATRWFRCRLPTSEEAGRLAGPWHRLLARAGIGHDKYRLVVMDTDELNAFALGGYVVAVSSLATRTLPDRQLEAVLAHELGHHLSVHGLPRILGIVLMFPVNVSVHLVRYALRVVRLAWRAVALVWRGAGCLVFCVVVVVLLGAFYVVVLLIGPWALAALVAIAGMALARRTYDWAEFEADGAAVTLGLGPDLLAALDSFVDAGHYSDTRAQQRLGMRPQLVRRAERLRRTLTAQKG